MEPISLILAALIAGATTGALDGLKDDAKEKAKAAYERVRGLARKRVANRPDGELALARYQTAPESWQPVLTAELKAAGAADDADLLAAAKELMELIDGAGAKVGKYVVTINKSKGVQSGDHNVQVNHFGTRHG